MRPRTCPICTSERIILILRDGRKGVCYDCGSQWLETILGETALVSAPQRPSDTRPRQPEGRR
jgi:hypothetical protein